MSASALNERFASWDTDRVVRVGLALALAAGIGNAVAQVTDFELFDLRIALLDSDTHASIFGIASLVAQGAAAAAAVLRGVGSAQRNRWLFLAALLLALLAVRAALPDDPAALIAPLAVAFALFWLLTANDDPAARTIARLGLLLLAFSFLIHLVGPRIVTALGGGYRSWPYELKGILKHSTELAGWMLMATALLAGRCFAGTRIGRSAPS